MRPVAWAGMEEGYLTQALISWSEKDERGRGPTGTALRTRTTCHFPDCTTDVRYLPWREEALKREYRSCIALPLLDPGCVPLGVLTLYSSNIDPFTPEEIRLLEELAADLAFGVVTLRTQKERKDLEEQLRQAQKLEAIGRLAGGIAHDFNNLLTVINGYSDLALADLGSEDPYYQILKPIQEAGQRAADLTRQLLLFSRKAVLQPRVVNLNELIARITRLIQRIIGEDVRLELALDPQLWSIKADPSQVEQVVMNLVVNARDAMPQGGQLRIATQNMVPTQVQLTVGDSGVGMDEATRARIFEPFFTTKEPNKGTGLGLATVYGIITQAGGRIEVESRLGVGTTFRITLPGITEKPLETNVARTVFPEEVTGQTVLLVEDEDNVRLLAKIVLQREGFRVLEASDGVEALLLFEHHPEPVDVLVTDMVMPNMSGPELVKRVRQEHPEIRVLFMSGYARENLAERNLIGENIGYLQKPFLGHELSQAVRQIIGS